MCGGYPASGFSVGGSQSAGDGGVSAPLARFTQQRPLIHKIRYAILYFSRAHIYLVRSWPAAGRLILDLFAPLEKALGINRTAALFLSGGYIALVLAIIILGRIEDIGLNPLTLTIYIVIFSVIILALSGLPPILRTFLAWLLVILFSIWLVILLVQVITGNKLTPSIASARCLVMPWQPICENAISSVNVPDSSAPSVTHETADAPVGEEAPIIPPGSGVTAVYVQFAGYNRDRIIGVSSRLAQAGWPVRGAEQGGERLAAASGLNEVRFFHPEDAEAASRLALGVSAALPGQPSIEVRDFSGTPVAASARPGHLEVWISQ
jgi:hypothetical protein